MASLLYRMPWGVQTASCANPKSCQTMSLAVRQLAGGKKGVYWWISTAWTKFQCCPYSSSMITGSLLMALHGCRLIMGDGRLLRIASAGCTGCGVVCNWLVHGASLVKRRSYFHWPQCQFAVVVVPDSILQYASILCTQKSRAPIKFCHGFQLAKHDSTDLGAILGQVLAGAT